VVLTIRKVRLATRCGPGFEGALRWSGAARAPDARGADRQGNRRNSGGWDGRLARAKGALPFPMLNLPAMAQSFVSRGHLWSRKPVTLLAAAGPLGDCTHDFDALRWHRLSAQVHDFRRRADEVLGRLPHLRSGARWHQRLVRASYSVEETMPWAAG
jgi:hypothetical protein